MKANIFLAALPAHDTRRSLTQKMDACEAKRSPLIRLQWTHTQDLHVTIGFIPLVDQSDLRMVALALAEISKTSLFMVNFGSIKLYGNALVLCLEPYHSFANLHKKMNQKLQEGTSERYQFDTSKRYMPHMTLGRIRNIQAINALHKQQLISLMEEQFQSTTMTIQQAALMRHVSETGGPVYQTLQLYPFRG